MSFRGGGSNQNTGQFTVSITSNVAPSAGDYIIAAVAYDVGAEGNMTWPDANFVQGGVIVSTIVDGGCVIWAGKVANGTEGTTFNITTDSSGSDIAGAIAIYDNVDANTPLDVTPTASANNPASTAGPWNATAPGLSTGNAGRTIVHISSTDILTNGAVTTTAPTSNSPSSWTKQIDVSNNFNVNIGICDALDSAGTYNSTTTAVQTNNAGGNGGAMAFQIALRAAAAGGGHNVTHANTFRNNLADLVNTQLGSGAHLVLRDGGTVDSPGTAIATLTFNTVAFNAAVNGVITAYNITADSNATGHANAPSAVTMQTSNGTVLVQFAIDGSDSSLSGGNVVASGDTVTCTSLTYNAPP